MSSHSFFRLPRTLLAGLAAIALIGVASLLDGFVASAQAQVSISAEFRTALSPHGRWQNHPRWGEVWIANRTPRDWRPYTRGRWVFTDEWGWYWVSGDEEADWGWVTYHHGRWVFDRDFGWAWIPGNEWGPAWVDWRRGTEHVGWAPLPPDEINVEYRDDPIYWTFVRPRYLLAPRVFLVIVPPRERIVIIRRTVVVNRTVLVERDGGRRRFAVNPGIEPRVIAAAVGRPIRASKVEPVVLAGTQVEGGVEVKPGERRRARVTETDTVIRPADKVEPPRALGPNEQGRLGDRPPKAAQNATPVQPGAPQRGQPGDKPAGAGEGARPGAADRDKPAGAGEGTKPGAADRGKPAGAGEDTKPGAADRGKPAGAGEGAGPDRGKPAGRPAESGRPAGASPPPPAANERRGPQPGAGEGGNQRNQRNERGGASPPPQSAPTPAQERRAAPPPPPPQRAAPQRQPAVERSAPPPRPPAAERSAPAGKPAAQKSKQQQEDERRKGR